MKSNEEKAFDIFLRKRVGTIIKKSGGYIIFRPNENQNFGINWKELKKRKGDKGDKNENK